MNKQILKIYVTGETAISKRAITNLRKICDEELGGAYQIVIVDVLENPQLAEDDKILATPTVVRVLPPPMQRIIGDLTNTENVLIGLDLKSE